MTPEEKGISATDARLIADLRSQIADELRLLPAYDDDYSLLRWLVGYDRKIDAVVPRVKRSLRTLHALRLQDQDFSTVEKIMNYCDSISANLHYLPSTLLGNDKEGNVVSLQIAGQVDAAGLLPCTVNSHLYITRIAESEGSMRIIRENEKRLGRQCGTVIIFDMHGLSLDQISVRPITVITWMLGELQELFPDVVRRIFVIRAPSFMHVLFAMVSPCLAAQTRQKIEFLGSDNWQQRLLEVIDASVLYPEWGGTRADDEKHVRRGGKVPVELRYNSATVPDEPKPNELTTLKIGARSVAHVTVSVTGEAKNRRLRWWWRIDSNDVYFGIFRQEITASPDAPVSETTDELVQPVFRLQTDFVPEKGEIDASRPGLYKLFFDNRNGKLWSKTVRYKVWIEDESLP